tara:strand:+ start:559 stop:942 length:384 start_codon:yes stop_codon:yes gene_type:complete
MKRGIKKDWDSILKTAINIYDEMDIMEDWVNDWIERDKDSKLMSGEQYANHEIDKKKINQHLSKMGGWKDSMTNLIMKNPSIIEFQNKDLLKIIGWYSLPEKERQELIEKSKRVREKRIKAAQRIKN